MKKRKFAIALAIAMTVSGLEMPASLVYAEDAIFESGEEVFESEALEADGFYDGEEVVPEEITTAEYQAENTDYRYKILSAKLHAYIDYDYAPGEGYYKFVGKDGIKVSELLYDTWLSVWEYYDTVNDVVEPDDTELWFSHFDEGVAVDGGAHVRVYMEDSSGNRYDWDDILTKEDTYSIKVECLEYDVDIKPVEIKLLTTRPHIHTWSEWTVSVPPSDTAKGEEARTCSACGKIQTRELTERIDYEIVSGRIGAYGYFEDNATFGEEGIKASEILKTLYIEIWQVYNPVTQCIDYIKGLDDADGYLYFNNNSDTKTFCSSHVKVYLEDSAGIQYGWDDVITKEGIYKIKAKCLEYDAIFYVDYVEQINLTYKPSASHSHTWSDWKVTTLETCTKAGVETRTCACGESETREIPATGHTWGNWTTTAKATVFAPEKQQRTCSCGAVDNRDYGSALKSIIKLNVSTKSILPLKVKQTLSTLKVTEMAAGDSVKSWKSSNTKVVTVSGKANGTCKIYPKKSGTAYITITMAGGASTKVKVQVKTAAVKTTSVTGVAKKLTLQKGKTSVLKPVIAPISSKEKVTYTSSNKKVATVSSKGVIKAVNPGTAKITVKSGTKKVYCTVKVTGIPATKITGIPSKLTLKKYKTKALKPVIAPKNTTDKVTYKSSNSKVVTVSSKGVLKAKKKGTATITVKAGKISVKCKVTVK